MLESGNARCIAAWRGQEGDVCELRGRPARPHRTLAARTTYEWVGAAGPVQIKRVVELGKLAEARQKLLAKGVCGLAHGAVEGGRNAIATCSAPGYFYPPIDLSRCTSRRTPVCAMRESEHGRENCDPGKAHCVGRNVDTDRYTRVGTLLHLNAATQAPSRRAAISTARPGPGCPARAGFQLDAQWQLSTVCKYVL